MYQPLLTRRYLFSKVMPLLAAVAVALCTAMVLVVWSVMGGFLAKLLESGKSMIGDVSISYPIIGIPHYERLIADLKNDPAVEAAAPVIETLGLLGLPSLPGFDTGENRTVTVLGVEPESYHAVTGFADRLYWKRLTEPLPKDANRLDPRLKLDDRYEREGRALARTAPDGRRIPGIVVGLAVTQYNQRQREGFVVPFGLFDNPGTAVDRLITFAPNLEPTIGVLPLSRRGVAVNLASQRLPIVNEFRTGLFEADANWVIMPLSVLQPMLKLDAARRADGPPTPVIEKDARGNEVVRFAPAEREEPARVTTIMIRARPGFTADELETRAEAIYEKFAEATPGAPFPPRWRELIYTWENKPGLKTFIQAVKKETALVLVLFTFISLVAVFLVFAIFWAMISEKTKDIGVLRAIGSSRGGVAWLFLRYGAAIGVVGSLLGGVLAYAIVLNINPIHEWLGRALGIVIWDPQVYYFTEIPSKVDPLRAAIVLCAGVLSSVLGAL
ncbi:MAG: ABC transporter permease, partial [Phycisphaerales bacterium]|nr:ABC transporter permease [Phycisphaerales bacterium]